METNLRATFAGISVILPFCGDEQNHFCDPKTDNSVGSQIDYLGAECNEIVIALKVSFDFMISPLNPLNFP